MCLCQLKKFLNSSISKKKSIHIIILLIRYHSSWSQSTRKSGEPIKSPNKHLWLTRTAENVFDRAMSGCDFTSDKMINWRVFLFYLLIQSHLLFNTQVKITQCTHMHVHWQHCAYSPCEIEIMLLSLRLFSPKGLWKVHKKRGMFLELWAQPNQMACQRRCCRWGSHMRQVLWWLVCCMQRWLYLRWKLAWRL